MPSNTEIVRQLYEAFGQRDLDALRELLHPDVEWIQCAGFPGGGQRHGFEEVAAKVFTGLRSEWDHFEAAVEEFLEAPGRVIVLGRYRGTHTETGKSMEAVFAHVYDLAEGRIRRFRQYADTHPMVEAMRS